MMQCHMACGISVNNDMETRTKYNVHIPRPPDPYPRSLSDLAFISFISYINKLLIIFYFKIKDLSKKEHQHNGAFISNCIDTKNAESRAEEFVHPVYLCYEQQML